MSKKRVRNALIDNAIREFIKANRGCDRSNVITIRSLLYRIGENIPKRLYNNNSLLSLVEELHDALNTGVIEFLEVFTAELEEFDEVEDEDCTVEIVVTDENTAREQNDPQSIAQSDDTRFQRLIENIQFDKRPNLR